MNHDLLLRRMVRGAQLMLADHVKPRDDFENAVVLALGDISWDEAVRAIEQHRATPPQPGEP